jgi:hypothetical protein
MQQFYNYSVFRHKKNNTFLSYTVDPVSLDSIMEEENWILKAYPMVSPTPEEVKRIRKEMRKCGLSSSDFELVSVTTAVIIPC